ncbi:MFS transporter [Gordonia soli]|uniref:Putative major facilitator superfamily transporter n=1 Tax=Gordonia soli NBRC 108243 TaxID=1223545 RepID=M0QGB9_9ACTN|nr:MFS transporter [Gordonia soli]GAC67675.1 putative major facilitator superfamily transporter [Gordonia soli NBRC 108243]
MSSPDIVSTNPVLDRAMKKAYSRIVPLIMIMFVLNYIDRVNIGFAKHELELHAGITAGAYGLGAGLFFITYAIFEVPSNALLERFGAKAWLTRIMITWGIVSGAMMFVQNTWMFYGLRLLLGVAEAGFFAGVLLYFTYWFPDRFRGRANSSLYIGSVIGAVIAAPVSGIFLSVDNFAGLYGWQWMFLVEGGASVIVGFIIWFFLVSKPHQAKWLSAEEKQAIAAELETEAATKRAATGTTEPPSRWRMLLDPQVSLFCAVMFAAQVANYGITFWLPSVVRSLGDLSELQIGVIAGIPYALAGVGVFVAARFSDRTGLRRTTLAIGFVAAAVGALVTAVASPIGMIIGLCLATIGFKVAAGSFYAIPQKYLDIRLLAPGLALINSIGNLGGFVAPNVLGAVEERTGDPAAGFLFIAAVSALAIVGVWRMRSTPKNQFGIPDSPADVGPTPATSPTATVTRN